jgi:hypothetical protein
MKMDPKPFKRVPPGELVKVEHVTQAMLDSREVRITLVLQGGAKQQLFLAPGEAEDFARRISNCAAAITYTDNVQGLYRSK